MIAKTISELDVGDLALEAEGHDSFTSTIHRFDLSIPTPRLHQPCAGLEVSFVGGEHTKTVAAKAR